MIRLQRLIAYLETDISKHLARMILMLMVGLMMCTAIFQLVENDDPGARMERYMSGYETSKGGKRREEERRGTERGTNNLPLLRAM